MSLEDEGGGMMSKKDGNGKLDRKTYEKELRKLQEEL